MQRFFKYLFIFSSVFLAHTLNYSQQVLTLQKALQTAKTNSPALK
jgi:hypothetical protein